MRLSKKILVASTAAAVASCSALCLSGCLESDVLVNYVLDQENGEVDYSNPEKLYVPDRTASLSIDDLAEELDENTDIMSEVIEDLAVRTDESNTEQEAEESTYSETGDSKSTAAQQVEGDGADSDTAGDGEGDDVSDSDGKKNASVDSSNNVYDGSFGEVKDLPDDIETVCAVGNAATITMSIAGEGTLVGTSAEYKSDPENAKVFSNRGLGAATVCWSSDGMSKDAQVSKIIKAAPDAVLVTSGEKTLTVSQEKTLGDAGIRVIVLPALTSDTNIRSAVKTVGKLFAKATGNESEERAESYASAVDDALAIAKKAHGGGIATYQRRDYNDAENRLKTTSENTMSNPNWTVFVTNWDANAVVSGSFSGDPVFTNVKGVASTWTGWSWSPISYYMSCGGAINNAAAYGDLVRTPALRTFTQYSEKALDFVWSVKPKDVTFLPGGGSISNTEANALLTNGYDAYDGKAGTAHPLGSADFNKVFVASKEVKKGLDAAKANDLYKPVSWQSFADYSGYGINLNGKLVPAYSVVADEARGDTGYEVIVNPTGMVGSWHTGSMESYLEALWIASQYYEDKVSEQDVMDAVESFYRDFYGYSLSSAELKKIIEGDYAESE